MSTLALDAVFASRRTRGTDRLVLLALADRAHDDGLTLCGVGDIAARANIDERNAERAIGRLLDTGELVLRRRGGGRMRVNIYQVRAGRSDTELVALWLAAPEFVPDTETPADAPGFSHTAAVESANPDRNPGANPLKTPAETPAGAPGEPEPESEPELTEKSAGRGTSSADLNSGFAKKALIVAHSTELLALTDPDPGRARYEAALRDAKSRQARGPSKLDTMLRAELNRVNGKASGAAGRPPRRRIPDAQQARSETMLRASGLSDEDAADLSQSYPGELVEFAVAKLRQARKRPTNVGGWLRRVMDNEAKRRAGGPSTA